MRLPTRKAEAYKQLTKTNDPHITEGKVEQLKRSLKRLIEIERPRAIIETQETGAMGDFSENAEYQYAKAKLRRINNRITNIEEQLKNAVIIPSGSKDGIIGLGSKIETFSNDKKMLFHLVGPTEANPFKNRISHLAPLGQALIGKKEGEAISVNTPAGEKVYQITCVE